MDKSAAVVAAHTPTPWRLDETPAGGLHIRGDNPDGSLKSVRSICLVGSGVKYASEETRKIALANAALIVAVVNGHAPLLAALKSACIRTVKTSRRHTLSRASSSTCSKCQRSIERAMNTHSTSGERHLGSSGVVASTAKPLAGRSFPFPGKIERMSPPDVADPRVARTILSVFVVSACAVALGAYLAVLVI